MARYEYDEEASERLHVDVVHEVDDPPATVAQWVQARRRLNSIADPLVRRILALHRDCGSGSGQCDDGSDDALHGEWGCETTALIAHHFAVEYPAPSPT